MDGSRTMTQSAISLPFSFDSNGAVAHTEDDRKIWQDRVMIVVLTYISERVMRPTFGTRVKEATFENLPSSNQLIEAEVSAAFASFLPELTLIETKPTINPDNGILEIEIVYKYGQSLAPETVVVRTATFSRAGELIKEGA